MHVGGLPAVAEGDDGSEGEDSDAEAAGGAGGGGAAAAAAAGAAAGVAPVVWKQSEEVPFPTCAEDLLPAGAPSRRPPATGIMLRAVHPFTLKRAAWHVKGDYLAAVAPAGASRSVYVHQLSKRASNNPFRKAMGQVQAVLFHPTEPRLYVANQQSVRVYDLLKGELAVKLTSGVKWISSMELHPSGDHLLLGSYDHRTSWIDTELSSRPFKTLRYHTKAVRRATFHPHYPLMATASDDGTVHVFHARVFNDYTQNPLIVPVKILRGHTVTSDDLGVLDAVFHPTQPWLFTAGADHAILLWHNVP